MTRAEFAKALAALLNLTGNATAAASFTDVPANHWAIGEIGALAEKKILEGIGAGKFGPKLNVTLEQVAKIVVTAMGLTPKADATVEGKTSAWATGYVAAAVEAGLIPASADYTKLATRGDLVDASFVVYEKTQTSVKSTKVVDSKNIEVTFTDGGVVKKELTDALQVGVATKVSVEYKGVTYEVEVKLEAITATAKLTGADKLELTFNQAVDTAKAVITVKNANGNTVNQTAAFNADKNVATLEFASSLLEGSYTVSVTGLQEAAITATFTAEDEKVAKIEFTSDKAVLIRGYDEDDATYTVGYKVLNQYGEDVTSDYEDQLTFTVGRGSNSKVSAEDGVLTVPEAGVLNLNDKIAVSVLDVESSTFANTVLTVVSPARVAEISIDKLYNEDGDTLTAGDDAAEYFLIVTAKDQYGNPIKDASYVKDDVVVSVSNQNYASVDYVTDSNTKGDFTTVEIDDVEYVALALAGDEDEDNAVAAGTSKVTIVSTTTGKLASFDVVVKEAVAADSVTFSSPSFAAAGEEFNVPFTAVDQFGNAITSASKLNAAFSNITVGGHELGEGVEFVADYVNNKVNLTVDGLKEGTYVLTAVTKTNKVINQTIKVGEAAVPTVISGIDSDFAKVYAVDATDTLSIADDVIIQDQYGRTLDQTDDSYPGFDWADYTVSITDGGNYVKRDGLTFEGEKKGSQKFTLSLLNADLTTTDKTVKGSAYSLNLKVVEQADIASYEVADLGKILAVPTEAETTYDKDLTVSGVLADGSKVAIPTSYYEVTTTSGNVEFNADDSTIEAFGYADDAFDDGDLTVNVIVAVKNTTQEPITKAVTVSDDAPAPATLALRTQGVATEEGSNVASVAAASVNSDALVKAFAADAVEVTDQYGVVITTSLKSVVYSGFTNDHTITTVEAGDTFNVVAITSNGKSITFKVIVK